MSTTETRVPSPEQPIHEQIAANLPEDVKTAHAKMEERQRQYPGVPSHFLSDKPFGEVVAAIAAVMAEIQPVGKEGQNTFHNYKYARMQDILQALTPLMGKHGIAVFQYESNRTMFDEGRVLAIHYNFIVAHKGGQFWGPIPQTGMSPCRTSKNTFDDKSFAKSHTSARKYFLLSLFQIPTEDEADPDNEKAERRGTPVPSPDGHVAPHTIEPTKRDSFQSWADRYIANVRTSKSVAEVDRWDDLNDDTLSRINADPKGTPIYDALIAQVEAIRERLSAHIDMHKAEPKKANPAQTSDAQTDSRVPSAQTSEQKITCPNAAMEPDKFMAWAEARIDTFSNDGELMADFEQVIMANADGLFKPDVDALKKHYEQKLAKIGG